MAVEPVVAFAIFTEEIGQWWRPGPINWYDSERAIGTRIEPGVGGRWIEVYDDAAGDVLEIGRVLVWEPGARLVLAYRDGGHELDGTEVEVRFEAINGGTRVTLEHRGWEKLRAEIAARKRTVKRWGWADIIGWFKEWAFWGSPRRVGRGAPAGTQGYIHVHSREDECFYVVEGSIVVRCGAEVFEAGPRSFVFLPRGIAHDWDVTGTGPATVLIITVPGGFEDFLHEHHAAGAQPDAIKDQIAAKYGITWLPD